MAGEPDAAGEEDYVAPGICSEGQSGGLLVGLLDSATGTNSFTGIRDDKERQKENRNRYTERHDGKHRD